MAEDLLARERVRSVWRELRQLRAELEAAEREHAEALREIPEAARAGARNLVHYVAFRRYDVRPLQQRLAEMGLSSLGRSEARIADAIDSVLRVLARLAGEAEPDAPSCSIVDASHELQTNTRTLLGEGQPTVVMVTFPSAAAEDPALVRALLEAGMGVARINCAHDGPDAWRAMARNLRNESANLDRPCKILFDLPGPKLRTLAVADDEEIVLARGESLLLSADGAPGRAARRARDGSLLEPARISCALPEAVAALAVGDPVYFDDGKIAGAVIEAGSEGALIGIARAGKGRAKLHAEKGINLPDTVLSVEAFGEDDQRALDVAVECADMVGLSFVRTREDVEALQRALEQRGSALGMVLKIETKRGFEQLPALLLAALRKPPVGVMIARGDLAVECGFERLAELQEEILWLCEAARVPCIWATQVLETLAKKGRLTRAEVTDAAMAERAECVMLNKGPHVVRAVRMLRNIVARMRGHQHKKTALLRRLESPRLG